MNDDRKSLPEAQSKQRMPTPPHSASVPHSNEERFLEGRGRTPVSEVYFSKPLPGVMRGNAFIGSGDGWKGFKVLADFTDRVMICSFPDKKVLRIPFENLVCFAL